MHQDQTIVDDTEERDSHQGTEHRTIPTEDTRTSEHDGSDDLQLKTDECVGVDLTHDGGVHNRCQSDEETLIGIYEQSEVFAVDPDSLGRFPVPPNGVDTASDHSILEDEPRERRCEYQKEELNRNAGQLITSGDLETTDLYTAEIDEILGNTGDPRTIG